ncbi:hypothetical protein KP509_05G097000 [Ceratopteris richardii]|uniref:Uncharacterized protein n=1 Tax=Ceratopteris richardii TaxID=49495 RepID=A0A8T2UPC0_CERRI|nr:hypothetical protein KP509_05G097000 [Ceratopteris richardii]
MAALPIMGGLVPSKSILPSFYRVRFPSVHPSALLVPSQRAASVTRMGLKVVHTYDSSFELMPECEASLQRLLSSDAFRRQVAEQVSEESNEKSGIEFQFTGKLFQPVPWSVTTRHGMPQEFEVYLNNPEYAIINVPPNFMFQAKVFKPSRLCAIFKKTATL